jgi:hypothetical protein
LNQDKQCGFILAMDPGGMTIGFARRLPAYSSDDFVTRRNQFGAAA